MHGFAELIAGMFEYRKRSLRNSWGGPFNGQSARRTMALELISSYSPELLIETGTYRGTTTKCLSDNFSGPVYTIESDPRNFGFALCQLFWKRNVRCKLGDSRNWLKRILEKNSAQRVFVYLDSHWNADLPLREEIEIVQAGWLSSIIMVDDFKVPDDEGYGFDSYGMEAELTLEYIRPVVKQGSAFFFPTARSRDESGRRRGCVIIAFGNGIDAAEKSRWLRRWDGI